MPEEELIEEEVQLYNSYKECCLEINAKAEKEKKDAILASGGKPKVLTLKPIDKRGSIITIVIIEVTTLLGMLLGVLALALR